MYRKDHMEISMSILTLGLQAVSKSFAKQHLCNKNSHLWTKMYTVYNARFQGLCPSYILGQEIVVNQLFCISTVQNKSKFTNQGESNQPKHSKSKLKCVFSQSKVSNSSIMKMKMEMNEEKMVSNKLLSINRNIIQLK